MSFNILSLPNELLLSICDTIEPKDLASLIRVNRRFAILLRLHFINLVCEDENLSCAAFFCAAAHRNEEFIRLVLGKTPRLVESVEKHLEDYSGFDACSGEMMSAYVTPEEYQNTIVRHVMEKGPDLVITLEGVPYIALHWAFQAGNISLVRVLLDQGADPRFPDPWFRDLKGFNILHKAVQRENFAMVEALLARGFCISKKEPGGVSVMEFALRESGTPMLRLLLGKGIIFDRSLHSMWLSHPRILGNHYIIQGLLERWEN